jgi:hypothetical protein
MMVYHGSICEVQVPDLSKAKGRLDFGKAFYVTSYRRQAEKWAKRKAMRMLSTPVVSTYQLADDFTGYRVLYFTEADGAWLDFVCACRSGKALWRKYDIIKGRVANDDVFKTVDAYLKGNITREVALRELSYSKPNDQIALITVKAINGLLTFKKSQTIKM